MSRRLSVSSAAPASRTGTGIGHPTSGIGHRAPVVLCPGPDTSARYAGLRARAGDGARPAVLRVLLRIHAVAGAHRGARRAGALAVRTKGTAGADDATAAAVVEVGLRVHARSTAGGEPRALGHAVASHAGLRGLTDSAAGPAVARVVRDVRAHARAVGQRGRAGARSVGNLPRGAPHPPTATVVGVGEGAHAGATAAGEAGRAGALAGADRAP